MPEIKIAHVADVHWRALSRHTEFRSVFQTFFDECLKRSVTHIFVGGDIFHTKTSGLSPEYIDQLVWWIKGLASVAPVHMILGNHDGNLANSSRQDAVTPIVNAVADDRVKLYKDSGVYQIAEGFNLAVYSLFDKEGWEKVHPIPGQINISCYHGPVKGSLSEANWVIQDGLDVGFFAGYDFCLLGDIHKKQFLATRQINDGSMKPWIGYPGTPIQQNYGEDLEHGFLLWTIRSRDDFDVDFVQLPNPMPYVTVQWTGDVTSTLSAAKKFPNGSRFRIKSTNLIPHRDTLSLITGLKADSNASEVTFKSDIAFKRDTITVGQVTVKDDSIRNFEVLWRLFVEHNSSLEMSLDEIEECRKKISNYLTTVTNVDEQVRNVKWSIEDVKWDNLFTYGEDNYVNFSSLSGVVGIFGPNRIGKSSIVGTLMYGLFNSTDRGPVKNLNVVNIRKMYGSASVTCNINATRYRIDRQTLKTETKKGQINAATSLNLSRVNDDGTTILLNGEQRTDTEKMLKSLIGNPEDFLMTSLSAQGAVSQYIEQGSTRRWQILSRFLDIDVFMKLYELSKADLAVMKAKLKSIAERDWDALVIEAGDRREVANNDIDWLKTQKESLTKEKRNLLLELADSRSQVSESQLNSLKKTLEKQTKMLNDLKATHEQLDSDNTKRSVKIKAIKEVINEYDLSVVKENVTKLKNLRQMLVSVQHQKDKQSSVVSSHKKSIKLLSVVPCNNAYPECQFIKDANTSLSEIDAAINDLDTLIEKTGGLTDHIKLLVDADTEGTFDKLTKLEEALRVHESSLENSTFKLTSVDSQILSISDEIDRLQTQFDELKKAYDLQDNVFIATNKLKQGKIDDEISLLEKQLASKLIELGKLNHIIERLALEQQEHREISAQLRIQEIITNSFSKNGIPSDIVTSMLPMINGEINKILQGIVDFTIELEADPESDSMEVYINYGDSKRLIELGSGMEKMIASVAIRVALITVSSLPKTDVFIIDEGFGALDDAGVEACNRLLISLKRYFKAILVITHVDGIKDSADALIEITRIEKDSRVVYG